jgi:hypothetical protein
MTHLSEEQLVLQYYGEGDEQAATEAHLKACPSCAVAFDALRRVLDAMNDWPVPERSATYGSEVWWRIRARLARRRTASYWAAAVGIAAMLLVAFFAGRMSHQVTGPHVAGIPGQVRERILLVAVGDHLERSQMVLAELVNAKPNGSLDISGERQRAENLIGENRLYRQTALKSGDTAVASVLDELERVLLEIAHSPAKLSSPELEQIRNRIEAEGIVFKVRVVGSNIRERGSKSF